MPRWLHGRRRLDGRRHAVVCFERTLKAIAQLGRRLAGDRQVTETRAALTEAAIAVLRESGFASASARRIAQRAGCNQALVFYHFGSVNDLLVAALEDADRADRRGPDRVRDGPRRGPRDRADRDDQRRAVRARARRAGRGLPG